MQSAPESPSIRLWPAVVILALQWTVRFLLPLVAPDFLQPAVLAGMAGGLLLALWWLFFSRVSWTERLKALALVAAIVAVTPFLLHESVATGNMGFMFAIYAVPVVCLAFVLWAAFGRSLPTPSRWIALALLLVVSCGMWTLVRTGGNTADLKHDFAWRFTPTPEEELLAQSEQETMVRPPLPAESPPAVAAWPGFRGPRRDGVRRGGPPIDAAAAEPPEELWRRPIGPGWSSFAVQGDLIYTQEQRGDDEAVSCYRLSTGEPVWRHLDSARFWESVGGAGPRGTPTLYEGKVYSLGATGLVNALDARDGSVVWSQNAAKDTKTETPGWGYSGSPWVSDELVVVPASGVLVAYDRASGELRWTGPAGDESYVSPQYAELDGVPQLLHLSGKGLVSVSPDDGSVLWQHPWKGYPIVQPALTPDGGGVLAAINAESGIRRLDVTYNGGEWNLEEIWTSRGLKPYFNDFVIHEGHVYGFDRNILAAIDLETGERRWKGGRYGGGQMLLLADQDLLLVLSEKGEVALVSATPETFQEKLRFPGVEGKTWNHPVVVGRLLLVRNAEEMAAFRF